MYPKNKKEHYLLISLDKILFMKNSLEIIVAGLFGTATVLGIFAARKYFKNKLYNSDYSDHHLLFGTPRKAYANPNDGVELDAFL